MSELADLKTQRSSTKGCITRIKNLVEQKADTILPPEIECRLGILESYFKQVLVYQTSIEKLVPNDANELKFRGELEDLYCATKSKLLSLMAGSKTASDVNASILIPQTSISHLPKLKLPQFSGKYAEYPNFIGSFAKLVHKDDSLSPIEKFNHLISCLSGPALRTIKVFEVTEENYTKALEHLKIRYDNKYLIFQEHIIDLFNLSKISKNSPAQLRNLVDSTTAHLSALQSLGTFEDIANALIIYLVSSKLDPESQSKWEESMDISKLPTWNDCAQILNRRCQYLEARDVKLQCHELNASVRPVYKAKPGKTLNSNLTSLAANQSSCLFCNEIDHAIYKCRKFLELPILDRFNEIKRRALCLNCLNKGHSVKKCVSKKCRVCGMPHHTLLHRYSSQNSASLAENALAIQPVVENAGGQVVGSTSLVSSEEAASHVFLATAIVKIKDRFGCYHFARALLDSASQLNFMSENLSQILMLKRNKIETNISGIGDVSAKVRYSTQANFKSRMNDYETNLTMYILPNITGAQPERKVSIDNWDIPGNIPLADPEFYKPQRVDLLIGADTFFNLLCVGQIKLGPDLPTLQKTLLGWIVSGRYSNLHNRYKDITCVVALDLYNAEDNCQNQEESLSEIVERFWKDEEVGTETVKWNHEQSQCEAIFKNKFRRSQDGRFMVKLPFKSDPQQSLGNSLEIARKRFYSLERRLCKDNDLRSQYSEFLKEYLAAGHMELISINDVPKVHFFMPHQCVLRPDSSTTKLRVVFDASSCSSSNKSLNSLLMVGPTLQDDLFSIVLRFRCYKYALTADIAAMYRQILIYPEDRNFQLILWRENPIEELQVFRLKTVTYGTASAPFLATRCLLQLAQENAESKPEASKIISKDFYMDDLITGADSQEDLFRIKAEVEGILALAHFQLRKWYSNNPQFLRGIPESEREKPLRINDSDIVKTLGVVWEPIRDEFHFHYSFGTSSKVTKRSVLSDISRLFDPLGLINPIVVKAKVFLQELWILKLSWDESIPLDLEYRWREFKEKLKCLRDIRIPRLVLLAGSLSGIEIHGFADASVRAYGCCVYIRVIDTEENITVRLLSAKSKVAPLKTSRSLPCLELCAAVLLSRLVDRISRNFHNRWDKIYLWTDSEIVLDWIGCHPSNWKTYVANRVSEIQERTKDAIWRHVTSKSNPADIISRGMCAAEISNSIWFSGPHFLLQEMQRWPHVKERHKDSANLPERRKVTSILICSVSETFLETIYKVSNFINNCRRFALVLRFINNLKLKRDRKPIISGQLSEAEIEETFIRIIWAIQQRDFADDIRALECKDDVKDKSGIKKLSPFLDDHQGYKILRVGGRLRNSDLPYHIRCPILMPRKNAFVTSYIRFLHHKHFHAGPLALVAFIRQRFWIVNAREQARKVVRECLHCFRYRPRLTQQIMGDLPSGRVQVSLPFTHSGVDFGGPIQTTYKIRGKTPYKSYIAIFVCFSTRAVHIEVVSDLTAEAFIAALKRFISRRNLCKHLYCDNATNFVGARRQLDEFRTAFFQQQSQKDINNWCSNNGVEFHHIPPRSPHFGGIWEAAIKSAKTHLYRTLRDSLLTFEELTTVMAQIEAVLNSRPITPLSTDPNDEQALTPAHFLNQAPLEYFVEPDLSNQKLSYLRRWQRVAALQQHFWRRWSKEYVVQLQEKAKWKSAYPDIKIGTLVLVHQDDSPPYRWKLGRIISCTQGSDGHIRVVSVKTANGIIQRSIQKVAPLPIAEDG